LQGGGTVPGFALAVIARAAAPAALVPAARAQTDNLSERALVEQVVPFESLVDRSVLTRRNRAWSLSVLGVLGVVLASVGIFGVTSYAVVRKTPEIGIRIALGATRRRVLRTVIGSFAPAIACGVLLGLFGAWALTGVLATFLYGVTPTDPLAFGAAAALLLAVALAAVFVPARRAASVDPLVALRCE
jgi:predicted lysophospholipase L1 biosynthesis ABC-type transport system permease subunit